MICQQVYNIDWWINCQKIVTNAHCNSESNVMYSSSLFCCKIFSLVSHKTKQENPHNSEAVRWHMLCCDNTVCTLNSSHTVPLKLLASPTPQTSTAKPSHTVNIPFHRTPDPPRPIPHTASIRSWLQIPGSLWHDFNVLSATASLHQTPCVKVLYCAVCSLCKIFKDQNS